MAYIDLIALADAKLYLKIDDDLTEDDSTITRMINACSSKFERLTNVLLFPRDKEYFLESGCVRVYDFPINTFAPNAVKKSTYTNYTGSVDITLNVGYENIADVPSEYVEVILEMIDLMYYEKEDGKPAKLSELGRETISNAKRFFL